MWLFTSDGFYSVVQHNKSPHVLLVRARAEEDATALRDRLADIRVYVEVQHTPDRDYAYRLEVPRSAWSLYLQGANERIDYTNFKDSVAKRQGDKRAYLYGEVWATMMELQMMELQHG